MASSGGENTCKRHPERARDMPKVSVANTVTASSIVCEARKVEDCGLSSSPPSASASSSSLSSSSSVSASSSSSSAFSSSQCTVASAQAGTAVKAAQFDADDWDTVSVHSQCEDVTAAQSAGRLHKTPKNWRLTYNAVCEMRKNRDAPVDT